MSHPSVTHATETLHNPSDPRHFMRLKPLKRRLRVKLGDVLLADTSDALLLQEVGRDFYDPTFYIPAADVVAELSPNAARTHCPLKGDASYFDLVDPSGAVVVESIAWSYAEPFNFAAELRGRVAFYPERVTFEDAPPR